MDPQVAVWVGLIVSGLIAVVGYVGKRYLDSVEKRVEREQEATAAMTADRDWWRDKYFGIAEPAETAVTALEKAKGRR